MQDGGSNVARDVPEAVLAVEQGRVFYFQTADAGRYSKYSHKNGAKTELTRFKLIR